MDHAFFRDGLSSKG